MVLSFASLAFYAFSGIYSLIYISAVSLSSYIFAILMQKCRKEGSGFCLRLLSALSLAVILGIWGSSRLRGIGILGIWGSSRLPGIGILGISFYSLRVMSYLIEVKRGRIDAERNFPKYLLFTSFFPIAVLGPILSYGELSESLFCGKGAKGEDFLSGVIRLLWGIFKKCVIADMLAGPLALIYEGRQAYSGAYVLFLLIFYSAEIYCDFSGGIDISIGVAVMLGIKLPENFDRPFSSRTLGEFWRRWHITLGKWFERYVFYPVSLSKPMQRISKKCRRIFGDNMGKKLPVYTATMLTWLLTGLWHGAERHFIAWGVINGALVIMSQEILPFAERFYNRHPRVKRDGLLLTFIGRVRVFLIIGAVRLLDLYKSLPITAGKLSTVFCDLQSYGELFCGGIERLLDLPRLAMLSVSLILLFSVSAMRIKGKDLAKRPLIAALCIMTLSFASVTFGTYGIGFDAGEFIYSRY